MNIFYLFLGLAAIAAQIKQSSQADSSTGESNYTYTITANRISQIVPAAMPIMYLYYNIYDPQNITYFKEINSDNPFTIEFYIGNAGYEKSADGVNACTVPASGTWDYVAVKIIQMNLMPNANCPINPGNYMIRQRVDPIIATFPTMIYCGDYELTANLYRHQEWAVQVSYEFTIKKDDNCIPED